MPDPTARRPLLLALAAVSVARPAAAQADWPIRPPRLVVPFPPGSISDAIARMVTDRLAGPLGQRFVIDNRGGAAGNIGTEHVARSEADGYTFGLASSGTHAANIALYRAVGYDPQRDFEPVAGLVKVPNVLVVRPTLGADNVAAFIALARSRPGEITYGSIGNGSSQHLAGTQFEQLSGVRLTHVPYRAVPPLLLDMAAGRLDASFQLVPNVVEQVRSGQLRALAAATPARLPALPGVPTMAEAGVAGFETAGWFGVVAPRGTPAPIVERLAREITTVLAMPEIQERLAALGCEPLALGPAAFRAFIGAEVPRWREIVRASGAQLD
ncbi:MAG: tripartite tricarboxylate transporter substrate binding protein [Acetobacteraceae bacterium]|nr:tripartite tricarboxylate transporter substrate binding protein [Acetobacteraceae bacterium]